LINFSSSSLVHLPFFKLGSNELHHLFLQSLGFLSPLGYILCAIMSHLTVSASKLFIWLGCNSFITRINSLSSYLLHGFLDSRRNVWNPRDSVMVSGSIWANLFELEDSMGSMSFTLIYRRFYYGTIFTYKDCNNLELALFFGVSSNYISNS